MLRLQMSLSTLHIRAGCWKSLPLSRVVVRELGGSKRAELLLGWSYCSHKTNSPFHTIYKVPCVVLVLAVVVVDIVKRVNDTHYNNPILKTS